MDLFLRDSLLEISLLKFSAGDISWRLFVRIFSQTFFGIDFSARIQVQISLQILFRRDFSLKNMQSFLCVIFRQIYNFLFAVFVIRLSFFFGRHFSSNTVLSWWRCLFGNSLVETSLQICFGRDSSEFFW